MIKFRINILTKFIKDTKDIKDTTKDTKDTDDEEIEIEIIEISNKCTIGSLIRNISKNKKYDIDMINSKIIYNNIELKHDKNINNYTDFSYMKDEIYNINFFPILKSSSNKSSSIKSSPLNNKSNDSNEDQLSFYIDNLKNEEKISTINNVDQRLFHLEQRMLSIEKKLDIILSLFKKND